MKHELDKVRQCIGELVLGKDEEIKLSLACLVARGHLLIEDVPGVGKTLLAHALAVVLGLKYSRIQFTSDLLPSDILGVSTFDRNTSQFIYHEGPIFSEVLLADEINRANGKTQSALLEAMEERQVTVEGRTRALPKPFFVVATQNPMDQVGTFPLPESQLDRFLMRVSLGYPGPAEEQRLWREPDRRMLMEKMGPCCELGRVNAFQDMADSIHVSEELLQYVYRLVDYTRHSNDYRMGLSPRGGASIIRAARAWALMEERDFTIPEDVQAVLPSVIGHRLVSATDGVGADIPSLLRAVSVEAGG